MRNSLKYILAAASMLMGVAAYAAGDGDDNGLRVNKTRSEVDANGNYTLTLTSFAVGEQTPNMVKPDVYAALVLDVSGSMRLGLKKVCAASDISTLVPGQVYGYGYQQSYYQVQYRNNKWQYYNNGWADVSNAMINRSSAAFYEWNNGETRLDALKTACIGFINTMSESETDASKLAIITYNDGHSSTSYDLKTQKQQAINKISGLSASSTTRTDLGMKDARDYLNGITDGENTKKVIVLFTDGEPSSNGTSFNTTYANDAIKYSSETRNVTVYSVNVYPDSNEQMHKFMNYVSSNYPNATSMTNKGTGYKEPDTAPHDYYKQSSNSAELAEIFNEIAHGFGGGSNFDPGTATVVVKDVLTPSFTIPEGGQVKIYVDDVKTAPAHPTNSKESDYTFTKSTTPASGLTPKIEGKTVSVEGFDFAANWVGYKYLNEEQTQKEIHGKQLRIEITVHKSEESEGGYEDTNDPSSGIYVGGQNYNPYPIPDVVFTNIVDLVITRSGMKAGETSIYQVKGGSIDMLVPVTAVNDTDPAKTVVSVAVNSTDDPKGDQIEYTVSEKTDWSWANSEETTSVSKKLARIDASGRIHNDNHFEFGVESTSDVIAHDEDNAKIN